MTRSDENRKLLFEYMYRDGYESIVRLAYEKKINFAFVELACRKSAYSIPELNK